MGGDKRCELGLNQCFNSASLHEETAGIHCCPFEQWRDALPNMTLDIAKNHSSLVQNHCLGTYIEIISKLKKPKYMNKFLAFFCDKMTFLGEQ